MQQTTKLESHTKTISLNIERIAQERQEVSKVFPSPPSPSPYQHHKCNRETKDAPET